MSPGDFPAWNLAVLLETDVSQAELLHKRLADAELVEVSGVDATGLVRYQLHDLLADFAKECLDESESESEIKAALRRLAENYIGIARRACIALNRAAEPHDAGTANAGEPVALPVDEDPQAWFSAERSRLVAVVEQTHGSELWDQAWRLTEILPILFDLRADWRSWEGPIPDGDIRPTIWQVMDAFWCNPTHAEAQAWGSYPYDTDPAGTAIRPLAYPLTIDNGHCHRGDRAWTAGSLALSTEPVRAMYLHQTPPADLLGAPATD